MYVLLVNTLLTHIMLLLLLVEVTVGFPEVDDPEDENKTVVYTVGEGDGEYHVDLSVVDGTVFKPFNVTVRAVRNRRANATAKGIRDLVATDYVLHACACVCDALKQVQDRHYLLGT